MYITDWCCIPQQAFEIDQNNIQLHTHMDYTEVTHYSIELAEVRNG